MPRVNIPLIPLGRFGTVKNSDSDNWIAGVAGDDYAVTSPGKSFLLIGTAGAAVAGTVLAVASPVTMNMAQNLAFALASGKTTVLSVPAQGYVQADGKVYIDIDVDTGVKMSAYSLE